MYRSRRGQYEACGLAREGVGEQCAPSGVKPKVGDGQIVLAHLGEHMRVDVGPRGRREEGRLHLHPPRRRGDTRHVGGPGAQPHVMCALDLCAYGGLEQGGVEGEEGGGERAQREEARVDHDVAVKHPD